MSQKDVAVTSQVDRRLALSFGALVLLLMLTVTSVASYLFVQLQSKEENRLSGALAAVLSESISRISFSGKYHARLLVEEMRARVPELVYLSVETTNGQIIAHSDPEKNDTLGSPETIAKIHASLKRGAPAVEEILYRGNIVKEVILPYRGGIDAAVEGIVRLGINVEEVRKEQRANRFKLFVLIAGLTIAAMGMVFILSRHFGSSVRALATQLQGVLNHAPLAVCISDATERIIAQSVEFERLFGRPQPSQTLEAFFAGSMVEADIRRLTDIDREIFKSGVKKQEEMAVKLRDQLCFWSISKFPIARDKNGQVTLICTFIQDITERKQALDALQESEATFRRLFESSSDAILLIKDNRFLECNQAALTALGNISRETLINSSPGDISPERQLDGRLSSEASAEYDSIALRDGYHRFDWVCRKADGILFYLDVALTRVVIKGQTMLHVTWRDITDRKQAELEREKLQSQLLQAHKMESVGRLAGGVAHDFNNMLQAILGNAALALDEIPPGSPLRENLEEIEKSAQRSADLTRQLLAFARKQTVAPKVLDLNATVEGMFKMLRRLIGEDIQLSWLPGANLWSVRVDPTQIDQVLANLCVNARDAIGGVGQVSIATKNSSIDAAYCATHAGFMPGDYVLLTVSDNGSGMDQEVLKHLFEPFFTTKGVGKGTGLGLATVYGIVKQNHGIIHVQSEPGLGTMFSIYLPRHVGQTKEVQADAHAMPLSRGSETILIVEDELAILRVAKRTLENLGYTVLAAKSPSEAIRLLQANSTKIHLLMTDVVMPELNGRDLAARLQSIAPNLKCLYMSGYSADVIGQHGVLDEGVNFIEKPFSTKDLAEKVRASLDPGSAQSG